MSLVRFPDTPRFEMINRLGEGGMGVVYAAYDREYETKVALKVLRFSNNGKRVQEFKNEFRSLQEIRHRNLARFLELMEVEGRWFFTMELVEGVNFLDWIRPPLLPQVNESIRVDLPTEQIGAEAFGHVELAPEGHGDFPALDPVRLQDGFTQLAHGLNYLHLANKVHRDIKPSNILVDRHGKVVVLDFGLATEIGVVDKSDLVATPVYMAPERRNHCAVESASDWYSVGVMLFEALTGQLPAGSLLSEILKSKALGVTPAPSLVDPGVDAKWDFLCACLLHVEPDKRPSGEEVLSLLGSSAEHEFQSQRSNDDTTFMGRREELGVLTRAYSQLSAKQASTIFVLGESGIGKSELIREFTRSLAPQPLLLSGRCYQQEAVPYKAVDGVIDTLASFLSGLKLKECQKLIVDDTALLVTAFPVLKLAQAFREAPIVEVADIHLAQVKSRIFRALRDTLTLLSQVRPVIVAIDDLQWADQDSLDLLSAVLRAPEAPTMMLIATVRTPSDPVQAQAVEERVQVAQDISAIRLGRLEPSVAEELVRRLRDELGAPDAVPAEIAEEAGGHPLFIEVLLRYCYVQGRRRQVTLMEALHRHISQLDESERILLELLSVAGRPVARNVVARASQRSLAELRDSIQSLQSQKLIRGNGVRHTDTIEPYHSRIQEVARDLHADVFRAHSYSLAVALEDSADRDAESLANFWEGAGYRDRALDYLGEAAEQAVSVLAFDHANRLYRQEIHLRDQGEGASSQLWAKLAQCLANSGLGSEAADAFAMAAQRAEGKQALLMRRNGAEQLLRCGRVDEGVAAMAPVLQAYQLRLPLHGKAALRIFLKERALLALRGMRYKRRDESEIDQEVLEQLDVCWAAMLGLFTVDHLVGLGLHTKHLRLALAAGEPVRIGRGLAFEAASVAAIGRSRKWVQELIERAAELVQHTQNKGLSAMVSLHKVSTAYLEGRWDYVRREAPTCLAVLAQGKLGTTWEVGLLGLIERTVSGLSGDINSLVRETSKSFDAARQNGNLYAELGVCSGVGNIAFLFVGESEKARIVASDAIGRWSQTGFHLQHLLDVYAQAQIDLYEGKSRDAWMRVNDAWPVATASGLLRVAVNRILLHDVRARSAIAIANGTGPPQMRVRYRRIALRCSKKLCNERYVWAQALGWFLRAQLAESKRNERLQRAIALFAECGMRLHEVIARAFLDGGYPSAVERLREEPVADADRLLRIYLSPLPA